jgi:hypothetical protein
VIGRAGGRAIPDGGPVSAEAGPSSLTTPQRDPPRHGFVSGYSGCVAREAGDDPAAHGRLDQLEHGRVADERLRS